jgi:Zn-dependent peptidase ImmA (M78 family)
VSVETAGREAAARFRAEHRLGVQPLGDLVGLIEQATGIDVAVLDVPPDEHGLTIRDPKLDVVFIGVARTRNAMRQRSTLAHELGHVLFTSWSDGHPGDVSVRSPDEIRADAFARHLLLPLDGLREFLADGAPVTEAVLSDVVQRFLVSPQIAAIAMRQGDHIDEPTKLNWMGLTAPILAARFGWSDHYRALQAESDERRAPQRLLARAIRGYAEGVVSAQTIATLRGIAVEAAVTELREAGIEPANMEIRWADPAELPDVQVDMAALDAALNAAENDAG